MKTTNIIYVNPKIKVNSCLDDFLEDFDEKIFSLKDEKIEKKEKTNSTKGLF